MNDQEAPIKQNKILKIATTLVVGIFICISGLYFFLFYPKYTVPILTYHGFGYSGDMLTVTPDNFEKQMRYLKDKGYKVIPLAELAEGIKKGKSFSHNTVVITIDDGYKDNFIYAYPILKKYGFPVTIFLITDEIGVDAGFLNWDEVREMLKDNISFGGHTKSHPYLPSIEKEDVLWDEMFSCKKVIEEHTGIPVDYFAYPYGGFTEVTKMLVQKAGYKAACTTNRGYDKLNRAELYELNRVSIRNRNPYFSFFNLCGPFRFRIKLSGYYNFFRGKKTGTKEYVLDPKYKK